MFIGRLLLLPTTLDFSIFELYSFCFPTHHPCIYTIYSFAYLGIKEVIILDLTLGLYSAFSALSALFTTVQLQAQRQVVDLNGTCLLHLTTTSAAYPRISHYSAAYSCMPYCTVSIVCTYLIYIQRLQSLLQYNRVLILNLHT